MEHTPLQVALPRATGRAAALLARGWNVLGPPPSALTRQAREWINRSVNVEKARRVLGFEPIALETGLDQTARELGKYTRGTPTA